MIECIDHGKVGDKGGYYRFKYKGKLETAHRVAYCFARGIPLTHIQGSVVRHKCDNPRCINPRHLLLGTHQDNMNDKVARNRQVKGESSSSAKLSVEDVITIRKLCVKGCREFGTRALARRYGVANTVICDLLNGNSWKHV